MLIKKFGPTNKGKQRLCLITDAKYRIKDPYEGTKKDQVDAICQQMKAHGVKFDCIVYREPGAMRTSVMDENDHILDLFSKRIIARSVHVDNPLSLLGALRTRKIMPVTVFRGDLEISSNMKIKVRIRCNRLLSYCLLVHV